MEHAAQDARAPLAMAVEALEYIAWPGPERDHWDRVNKAKKALEEIRGGK